MASTYSSNLNIEIITSGEQAGTWGDTTNQNWKRIEESRSYATQDLGGSTAVVNWTLPDTVDAYTTAALGSSSSGRASFVKFTNGNSGGTTVNIRGNGTGDDPNRVFFARNASGHLIQFDCGDGTHFALQNGATAIIYCTPTGNEVGNAFDTLQVGGNAAGTGSGAGLILTGGSITDESGDISFGNENLVTTGTFGAGATTLTGALTVGSSGSGYDVIFHSATGGEELTWDASDEKLIIDGINGTNALEVTDGNVSITDTLTATNIGAFNLTGKLNAGSNEIEGTNFDIDGGSIDAVTIGTNSAVTELQVDNININGNTISSTNSNGVITLQPNGTGNVNLRTDMVRLGDDGEDSTLTTFGTGDLIFNTNLGSNSGSITIFDGAGGNIDIDPNGSGDIRLFESSGSGDLTLSGNDISGVGTVTAANATITSNLDVDGNTTLDTTDVAGTLTVVGNAVVDQVTVNAGTVSTSSGNLTLDSSGGTVAINDNATVSGNLTVTGTTTLSTPLANSSLANSAVSYGGVTVALGASDATPAFNLSDATGLPISSGVSGLGSNVATFLGTPSSANLRSALTDETGTGAAVFANGPTLVAPALGTPASGNLANCTFPTLNQDTTGTAANATTAANVTVTANNSADETVYPIFVDGATGAKGAESDTGLTYNPSTGALTAASFIGTLAGTANIATYVTTSANGSNANFSLAFLASSSSSNQSVYMDANDLTYNPSSNTLSVSNITGTLTSGAQNNLTGSTSLATVGTVTTGTWNSTISGTGQTSSTSLAIGDSAGASLSSAQHCTFVGNQAGTNVTGNQNTAIGSLALDSCVGGTHNTALGREGLKDVTTGSNNTGIGALAGGTNQTGSQNTFIGSYSDTSATDSSGQIGIGYNVTGIDDSVVIGRGTSAIKTVYNGTPTWSTVSDLNIKKNIVQETVGLSLINALNPVRFNYKTEEDFEDTESVYCEASLDRPTEIQYGFIAQEVEQAVEDAGLERLDGLSKNKDGVYSLGHTAFIQPMVKAIQELSSKIDSLESRLAALE